ncbi:two-component system sensor histidine kinase NtrB [Megalodesulfovibrio paquesii]
MRRAILLLLELARRAAAHARCRLTLKLAIPIVCILFVCILVWSFYHIRHQQTFARQSLINSADRVASTVQLGLHYAMMLNSRQDIRAIVENCGTLPEIRGIRIFNKQRQVMFSADAREVGARFSMAEPLCQTCHRFTPALLTPTLEQRLYSEDVVEGERVLRLASPILNEPGCSDPAGCHFHSEDDTILGVLDISFSTRDSQALVDESMVQTVWLAVILFLLCAGALFLLVVVLIKRPVQRMLEDAAVLARGEPLTTPPPTQEDEIGHLATAIRSMGGDLVAKNCELARQRNLYQDLFEGVPCLVTVQDRDYRLLRFNRTFQERFSAAKGEFCFKAYKNRTEKCPDCPVEKTFETGRCITTEESGCYKDGSKAHWIVHTAPIYDTDGQIVAAMEMCLDITERKELERELKRSERKYVDIFNNIPSAVFVLDPSDPAELTILDCNRGAVLLYGHEKHELAGMPFLELFAGEEDRAQLAGAILSGRGLDQVRQRARDGREFFVSISVSRSEYFDRTVLLATASDITTRLETEQQLIQASKMATLGEMATGVAHEINQPLSVIQTSMDLVRRRLSRGEQPDQVLLTRMTGLATEQIERATRIINHMREFGRKAELQLEPVDLNAVLRKAFDFFGQQLALRNIELVWELDDKLPLVRCEPNRMEQVFINFLLNARDAIEEHAERLEKAGHKDRIQRRITVKTIHNSEYVTLRISDTGGGVPPAIAARIFEPFFTTKQVGKGTGLGLSISYGIIQDHGGQIHVSTNDAGGASFHIRLPVTRD